MKSVFAKCFSLGVSLILIGTAQQTQAQTITWGDAFGDTLQDSNGDALGTTFQFELGTFAVGFDPSAQPANLWEASWQAFDLANVANAGYNPAVGFFTGSTAIALNGETTSTSVTPGYDFRAQQAYIWAYDGNKSTAGGNEFALITDDAWDFPVTVSTTAPLLEFRLAATNTAIIGATNTGGITLQTAAVGTTVPEPSSALLTLLGLSSLLLRRSR